jgi:hypothetical protein
MDAAFSWQKFSAAGQSTPTVTMFRFPTSELRVGYRATQALGLEFPLRVSYASMPNETGYGIGVGVLGNLYFAEQPTIKPFIGVGPLLQYQHVSIDNVPVDDVVGASVESQSSSITQFGVRAHLGFDWQAFSGLGFRPALFYEHLFDKQSDGVPASNEYGASFGATIHFGPQSSPATRSPVQVSVGFGLTHFSNDEVGGSATTSSTTFALPATYIGVYFPVTSDQRLMLGGNIAANWATSDLGSGHSIDLQPRVEFNINPRYLSERSVRLGAQFDYDYTHFSSDAASGSVSQHGLGGDVSLTFPFGGSQLFFAGVGFDYLFANESKGLPTSKQISLKFGIDAR